MAFSAENSYSFTCPTISWSSVIPTLWCSISRRVTIVRFIDGTSTFFWLAQRWLALTYYQFTLSLVFPWLFAPSFYFFFSFIFSFFYLIFNNFFLFFIFYFYFYFIFLFFYFFFFLFFLFFFFFFYFYSVLLIFKLFFIYFLLLSFFLF